MRFVDYLFFVSFLKVFHQACAVCSDKFVKAEMGEFCNSYVGFSGFDMLLEGGRRGGAETIPKCMYQSQNQP